MAVKETHFYFNNKLYVQTGGVGMPRSEFCKRVPSLSRIHLPK